MKRRVAVIGAGPGGLACALLLAGKGVDVTVYEKQTQVGGRTSAVKLGDYTFDRGPTFLNMPHILENVFHEAGLRLEDYLDLKALDPMYTLYFKGGTEEFTMTTDRDRMKEAIERQFPGNGEGYDRFMAEQALKLGKLMPILQTRHDRLTDYLSPRVLTALPRLSLGRSLYDVLSDYFTSEELKYSFTFQAKYLGMSAWECPGGFSILSYMEHAYGVHHPIGGMHQVPLAMQRAIEELGGTVQLGAGVEQLILNGKAVEGVILESGQHELFDEVIIGADFAHAMNHLVPEGVLKKWSRPKIDRKKFSCSTFMLYLGVNRTFDAPHHTIYFAEDYEKNVREMTQTLELSDDFSFYVQNPSVIDPTLAPEGKSAMYVLVPVPNNYSELDWSIEGPKLRRRVLDALETRSPYQGIEAAIEVEEMFTPDDWEAMGIHQGATFNLGHQLTQMMYFRPHNQFEELDHLYLVGGGTHPGSGLPTIFESARITAELVLKKEGVRT
ncbi:MULTISPECIES: phytoene desaturase family protein [Exiguobacterium]|uniref:phytoene desaturase family protein n=1 Tax=Exiguobacterium TaxID=33986 RepID=UPI0007D78E27|nr:phytoene desaturase family protein [Exiguobacterium sp. KKBO11]OAI87886.1 phytoene desaturase [Exiguobacterium sp. KKBO11]